MVKSCKFYILALCCLLFVQAKAQELLDYPLDTINGEEVYRYEVERSIGLYRIGVTFNVRQSEIIRLNPQLRERGLHYGEVLYLPTGRPVGKTVAATEKTATLPTNTAAQAEDKPALPESAPSESVQETSATEVQEEALQQDSSSVAIPRKVIELALMLPFESQQTKRSGNAGRMLEFYQGALLALHDLQNDSTLYRLRVYDSERSERRINALCDSTELDSVQGILGLVYPIQIARMAEWCEAHKVPLLLPFSDDINQTNRTQLMQFNATDRQEADSICRWMLDRDSLIHCVAIETREADIASSIRTLRRQMTSHGIAFSGLALKDLMTDSATYALSAEKENVIILHTDRYQPARLLLPHLVKLQEQGYRIRLVSQYSWQKEHIDLPQIYTSMFRPQDSYEAYDALWEQSYTGGHVSDAPRYDLLGYDLMQALVEWLDGKKEIQGLQSDIRWVQVPNGGWQNAEVRVVEN